MNKNFVTVSHFTIVLFFPGEIRPEDMMSILRDVESGICRPYKDHDFPTTGSQVSLLSEGGIQINWFTATPDPQRALFKPCPSFDYLKNSHLSSLTMSPNPFPNKVQVICIY
jgi:hypothetical protein